MTFINCLNVEFDENDIKLSYERKKLIWEFLNVTFKKFVCNFQKHVSIRKRVAKRQKFVCKMFTVFPKKIMKTELQKMFSLMFWGCTRDKSVKLWPLFCDIFIIYQKVFETIWIQILFNFLQRGIFLYTINRRKTMYAWIFLNEDWQFWLF